MNKTNYKKKIRKVIFFQVLYNRFQIVIMINTINHYFVLKPWTPQTLPREKNKFYSNLRLCKRPPTS